MKCAVAVVALSLTVGVVDNANANPIGTDWTLSYDLPELSPPYYLPPGMPPPGAVSIPADETIYMQGFPQMYLRYGYLPPGASQPTFTMTLTQDLYLHAGETLSGWGRLSTYDGPGFADKTWVSIDGAPIWTLDLTDACAWQPVGGCNSQLSSRVSPWMQWSWTAPRDAVFALALNVLNDDQAASSAYFEHIHTTPVPEPSGLLFLGTGVLGATGMRFWKRR